MSAGFLCKIRNQRYDISRGSDEVTAYVCVCVVCVHLHICISHKNVSVCVCVTMQSQFLFMQKFSGIFSNSIQCQFEIIHIDLFNTLKNQHEIENLQTNTPVGAQVIYRWNVIPAQVPVCSLREAC